MAHTTSAKKALRQSTKRRLQNRSQMSMLKTLIKHFRAALENAEVAAEKREEMFRLLSRRLDQAASRNLLHSNTASRMKSRLRLAMNKAVPSTGAEAVKSA